MRVLGLVVMVACASGTRAPDGVVRTGSLQVPASAPRLPRDFVPTGYRVRLAIGDGLTGHIEIAGNIARETSLIWLDSDGLAIRDAHAVKDGRSVSLIAQRTKWQERTTEKLALRSVRPLAPGSWTLVIDYTAPIVEQAVTVDRGDPTALDHATEHVFRESSNGAPYVFTNFEPMGARRAFPCFDEPDVKVPWQLALDVAAEQTVVGNSAVANETALPGGRKLVELAPTRPLPSFLIAFAVGTFDVAATGSSASGVPVRVLVPHGSVDAAISIDLVIHALDLLEAWTGIAYPFDKLDLVAVPQTGARWVLMENTGLVMYRSNLTRATDGGAYSLLDGVGYHWFGSLVTAAWWDDAVLDEGITTFLVAKLVGELAPTTEPRALLLNRKLLFDDAALQRGTAMRPKIGPSTNSSDVIPLLDGEHAAAFLRMVERFAGADVLRAVLHGYLAAHANGSATIGDLTSELDRATGESWRPVLDAFLDQSGFPTLTFKLDCTGAHPELKLFTPPLERWTIPACVAYDRDGARSEKCAMVSSSRELVLDSQRCPSWVDPDPGAVGLYKTLYEHDQLVALVDHGWQALTPIERGALFSGVPDATLLASVGKLVAAGDDEALIAAGRILQMVATEIPDHAIAEPRAAWIVKHLAPFARNLHFHVTRNEAWNGQRFILGVVAATRDPELVREATALVPHLDEVGRSTQEIVLALAIDADPALLRKMIDEAGSTDEQHRARLANALERVPGTLAAFEEDPKRPAAFHDQLASILEATCDPSTRDRAAKLATAGLSAEASKHAIARLDACIVSRNQLDERLKRELGI